VRPPVPSCTISNTITCPAVALDSVELVTLPVKVILKLLDPEALNVGVAEKETVVNSAMSAGAIALYDGTPVPPEAGPAKKEFCAALDSEKLNAGVEVDVATDVVNKGLRFPELKLVTVPEPLPAFAHAGKPDTTVSTCPAVPIGNLAAAGVAFS
jgi:hypothetical protein